MDNVLWAVGRIGGIISLSLFTLSIVLGILTSSGRPLPGIPRFSVILIHRNISLLAIAFLALHVGSLLLDSYAKLGLVDVVVPFVGAFKPFWQGLGTVAFDLVIAVGLTGLLRHRLGLRTFRLVHWLSYAMWPVAVAHGIGNGTNGRQAWFIVFAGCCLAVAAGAAIWRWSGNFKETDRLRAGELS